MVLVVVQEESTCERALGYVGRNCWHGLAGWMSGGWQTGSNTGGARLVPTQGAGVGAAACPRRASHLHGAWALRLGQGTATHQSG